MRQTDKQMTAMMQQTLHFFATMQNA